MVQFGVVDAVLYETLRRMHKKITKALAARNMVHP